MLVAVKLLGQFIEIEGKYYKQYRGMGSLEAMREGSAARYGHSQKDLKGKSAPEGIEALKEASGSLREVLENLAGGSGRTWLSGAT